MQNLDDIKLKRFDMHWLIELIPEGFWMLFLLPDGIWLGAFVEKYFQGVLIVVRSLPWGPRGRAVKTLAANAGGRGFKPHRGQNLFFTIYSIL